MYKYIFLCQCAKLIEFERVMIRLIITYGQLMQSKLTFAPTFMHPSCQEQTGLHYLVIKKERVKRSGTAFDFKEDFKSA